MIGGFLADGEMPKPMGTAYKALLPYQTFQTRSRDLALAVGSEKLWKDFCPAIGCPELADDPRYRTNADRAKNRGTLIPKLQEVFLTRTYEEWEQILLPRGIPMGAINTISQVVEHPQVRARRDAGGDGPPARRQGAHGRRAGAAVGDAGLRAHARAPPRRAHRRGAARSARDERGGNRGAETLRDARPEALTARPAGRASIT